MKIAAIKKRISNCRYIALLIVFAIAMGHSRISFAQLRASVKEGSRVSQALLDVQRSFQTHARTASSEPYEPQSRFMRLVSDYVVVDAVAGADADVLLRDLEVLGLRKGARFGRRVSGLLPITAIDDLARLQSLKFIYPSYMTTRVGAVTSQGDVALNADDARVTFGVDGTGVVVGTLSDSYDDLNGAAGDIGTGDLPEGIVVLDEGPGDGDDEGRAMMQLIHDVAPGATQLFHSAFNGQADFAQGIIDLANAGADVIVDDIIYFGQAMFQDDDVSQAVDAVAARGVAYFSAAGNNARESYESTFVSSGLVLPESDGADSHDFDPGPGVDNLQSITVPEGSGITFTFQWSDPFLSISGEPGAATDLDILVYNEAGTRVLDSGFDGNLGGDPLEIFTFTNPEGSGRTEFNIGISLFEGPLPELIKYVRFDEGDGVVINEFDTLSPTAFGHPNAAGGMGVGAAAYFDTPAFGVDPPQREPFSSAGGIPTLFDINGAPTNELRNKPDIVAPDGTNTTFFGDDEEPDGFPNFFGTSAAAPHAAAVAALLLQADPQLTPAGIYRALESTAIDMDAAGFDFNTGFGLIQADKALASVAGTSTLVTWCDSELGSASGTQDTVYICISDLTGLGVLAYQMKVTFDENVLNAVGATVDGTIAASFGAPTVNTSVAGEITVGGFGTAALENGGRLVGLVFDVVGVPGASADLCIDSVLLNAGDPAVDVPAPCCPFRVSDGFDISGTVSYCPTDGAVANATLTLSGGTSESQESGSTGEYLFANLADTDYSVTASKTGDIGELSLTCFDAALVARMAVQLDVADHCDSLAADVDGDGNILMFDAAQICRYAVGLPPLGPSDQTGAWRFEPAERSYTPLNSNQSDQNFHATLLGDVDASWTPDGGDVLAKGVANRVDFVDQPHWSADGELMTTGVLFDGGVEAVSFQLELAYDASLLRYSEVVGGDNWNVMVNSSEAGRLRIGMFSTMALSEPMEIVGINWKVLRAEASSEVVLERALVNDELQARATLNTDLGSPILTGFVLDQNYPNPFNPTTSIVFSAPNEGELSLKIYNVAGQLVRKLFSGNAEAGVHELTWDARNETGQQVVSGLYFYELKAGGFRQVKRMVLMR